MKTCQFLLTIGKIENHIPEYIEMSVGGNIVKALRNGVKSVKSEGNVKKQLKAMFYKILSIISEHSFDISKEISNYGIIRFLKNEINQGSKGTSLLSTDLTVFLELAHQLLKHGFGQNLLSETDTLQHFVIILNETELLPTKLKCLEIFMYLSKSFQQRQRM